MAKYLLKYKELGRGKASGKVEIEAKNMAELATKMDRVFRQHLMSSEIGWRGGIVGVGYGRPVGKYNLYKDLKGKLKEVV
jgi:hypothetical protein